MESVGQFRAQGGQVHLTIAGDGPDRNSLQQRAWELGLTGAITWAGEIHGARKVAFFKDLDIFAQVSRHEGLPGAPLEAASHGVPLLVTEATHLGPEIQAFGAGLVLQEANRESIVQALTLAREQSDETWEAMGQSARRMIQEIFSWASRAERMHHEFYGLPKKDAGKDKQSRAA